MVAGRRGVRVRKPDKNKKSPLPTIAPTTTCNAIKHQGGGYCKWSAGYRTDHLGQGRCKFHGGMNPIRHGRYSTLQHPAIRDLIEQFEQDPEPLNILPELAAGRALFQDYIDRYQAYLAALLAWHESFLDPHRETEPKPRQILDISDAYRLLAEIKSIVATVEKIASENAISRPEFLRLQTEQGAVVERALERHLKGQVAAALIAAIQDEVRDGWLGLRTR